LVKNGNFGQKSKFDKNRNLVKNKNVAQKWKFWTKIEILVKNKKNYYHNFSFVDVRRG